MSHRGNITFIFKTSDILEGLRAKLPLEQAKEDAAKKAHEESNADKEYKRPYYGGHQLREMVNWEKALSGDVVANPHRMVKLSMDDIQFFGVDANRVQVTDGTRKRKQVVMNPNHGVQEMRGSSS